jgi:hypothetical protein
MMMICMNAADRNWNHESPETYKFEFRRSFVHELLRPAILDPRFSVILS